MSEQVNINVGDSVRVRYGNHAGEIASIRAITRHSNQYGSYERYHLNLPDGTVDARGIDSLERVPEKKGSRK
jgi:hypothetical protein